MPLGRIARALNTVLGLWLFGSIFVWPHTPAQAANAALVGIFIALTAMSAWTEGPRTRIRYLNVALGLWLFVTMIAVPTRSMATRINSVVVGALVCLLALLPGSRKGAARQTP